MKLSLLQIRDFLVLIDDDKEISYKDYFTLGTTISQWRGTGIRYKGPLTRPVIAYYPLLDIQVVPELPRLPKPKVFNTKKEIDKFIKKYQQEGMLPSEAKEKILEITERSKVPYQAKEFIPEIVSVHTPNGFETFIKVTTNDLVVGRYKY